MKGKVRLHENTGEICSAVAGYPGKPADLRIKDLDKYARQVKDFGTMIDTLVKNDIAKLVT
ncbi:MAG: hypothetical protein WAV93_02990 [Bacteroidales bacterium]